MLNNNRIKFLFIICNLLLLQSCFCYKGRYTEYGQPRKEIKVKNEFNKSIFEVIDTLALYERITFIRNENVYPIDNSLGKIFFRFYNNGKFSSFIRMGYDNENFKLISNYEFSRDDFNPLNSQMGYYYSKDDKIYLKRLTMNQCGIQIVESELIFKENTIEEINLQEKGSKNIYVKKSIPKEFLENWQPDW